MEINTMPFELNRLYNLDCEKSIKQIRINILSLRSWIPHMESRHPSISAAGSSTERRKRHLKHMVPKTGIKNRLGMNISKTFSGSQKTRLFSGRTIL